MSLTNFPQGVSSFGIPVLPGLPIIPGGKVLFVQSSNSRASDSNNGESKERPLATIERAMSLVVADAGDVVIALPGHVETVASAGALTLDIAGVSLIGVGNMGNRPKINFTNATTADMNVDAANILMHNFLFTGGIDALAAPLDINEENFQLLNCEWLDVTGQATDVIVTNLNADYMQIRNFRYRGAAAAGTNAGIAIVQSTGVVIDGLYMDGNFAVGGIDCRTAACSDLEVRNVWFRTRSSTDIFLVDTITGSTGLIGPNINLRLQDNAANITEAITGATFVLFDPIMVVNAAGERGLQINGTVSADS